MSTFIKFAHGDMNQESAREAAYKARQKMARREQIFNEDDDEYAGFQRIVRTSPIGWGR